jgi:hypothetical protein
MSRSIDEKKTRNSELPLPHELGAHFLDMLERHLGGADVLGDESRLARHDGRAADVIKQAGLAVVNMTKYTDYWLPDAHIQSDYGKRISTFLSTHEQSGLMVENLIKKWSGRKLRKVFASQFTRTTRS